MNEQAKNYLKRGFLSLEEKNFVEAESFFEDALNVDAELSDAYMGKLLCDMLCTTEEELISLGVPVSDNNYFKYAKRFAESPARFDAIESKIRDRAREKAAICHKDKNDNIAVLWLERIGEKNSDYGRYYQLSDYTDSFTSLNPGIFEKYPVKAKTFLNSVNALSHAISCDILPASLSTSKSSANKNLSILVDQSFIVIGICLFALFSAKSKNAETLSSKLSNSSFDK